MVYGALSIAKSQTQNAGNYRSVGSKAKGKLSSTLAPIPIGERASTLMAPCGDYPGVPLLGPWDALTMHQETDRVKTVHSYDPWVESVGVLLRRGGSRRTSKRGGQGVEADTPDSPAPGNYTGGTTEEYPTWHDQRRNL